MREGAGVRIAGRAFKKSGRAAVTRAGTESIRTEKQTFMEKLSQAIRAPFARQIIDEKIKLV
jgi:hypothetical protein